MAFLRGGLFRHDDGLPSGDIYRGPAMPGDARVWQGPEYDQMTKPATTPGDVEPYLSKASATDQKSLFDSDGDLAAWLARMTSPPPPVRGGYEHTFAPGVQARINAEIQPGYQDLRTRTDVPPTISPGIAATLGPLSLNGGLQIQPAMTDQGNAYTQVKPTVGAGLKVPLPGDATGEAKFSLTPGELLQLDAEYRRKLLGGDLSVRGSYSQPTGGPPGGSAMLRWGRKF